MNSLVLLMLGYTRLPGNNLWTPPHHNTGVIAITSQKLNTRGFSKRYAVTVKPYLNQGTCNDAVTAPPTFGDCQSTDKGQ
jgi:hypothetical protein